MTERSKFLDKINRLRKIILDGVSYFIVWEQLDNEFGKYLDSKSEKYLDYFAPKGTNDFWWRYQGFLSPARNALLWSAILQLSKAYDTDSRTVSLINLIAAARNNPSELAPYATQDSLELIQGRIATNSEVLSKLRSYRNTRLAHYDSTETETVRIYIHQISSLVNETKEIFNLLLYANQEQSDDFDIMMEDVMLHTSDVIKHLKKAEEQERQSGS
ncbi:hypothetical protein ACFLTB_02755 [Chloroflexota bacterium]